MVKLVNKVFILVVFIAFLFCGSQDNAYNNKLLFCLKKDVSQLVITRENNTIITGIDNIDNFVNKHNIQNIELWLPGATNEDHDGEIYLNKIYRLFLNERNKKDLALIKNQLTKLLKSCKPSFCDFSG